MGIAKLQFGRRLRALRQARGWSQGQLGHRLWPHLKYDSAQGRISHYESGRSEPAHELWDRLARVFDVSVLELLADPVAIAESTVPLLHRKELVKKPPRTIFDLKVTDDDSPPYLRAQILRTDPGTRPRAGDHVVVGFAAEAAPVICELVRCGKSLCFQRLDKKSPPLLAKTAAIRVYGVVISHTIFRR
mgnify:CR=1 FL=1